MDQNVDKFVRGKVEPMMVQHIQDYSHILRDMIENYKDYYNENKTDVLAGIMSNAIYSQAKICTLLIMSNGMGYSAEKIRMISRKVGIQLERLLMVELTRTDEFVMSMKNKMERG